MDTYNDLRTTCQLILSFYHVAQRVNSGVVVASTVVTYCVISLALFFSFVRQGLAMLFILALNAYDPGILLPQPAL